MSRNEVLRFEVELNIEKQDLITTPGKMVLGKNGPRKIGPRKNNQNLP